MTISTIIKTILDVNNIILEDIEFYKDIKGIRHLLLCVHPYAHSACRCPHCHQKCPCYDYADTIPAVWRDLDWGGIVVELAYRPHRIHCQKHGILTEEIPWAFPDSRFTKRFDLSVAWLALETSKSATSELMRISWATVGRAISRAHHELEPNLECRLDGLVHIGIDETSYKKKHHYITTVVNHDTNEIVWVGVGRGKNVLAQFYKKLTIAQRRSIEVTTGDGASWITECVEEYTPWSKRGVDPFHVVAWAGEVLDSVRTELCTQLKRDIRHLAKQPLKEVSTKLKAKQDELHTITHARIALNKAGEHLNKRQEQKLDFISRNDPGLYKAYIAKEALRQIFQEDNPLVVADLIDVWTREMAESKISRLIELGQKIMRHKEHILVAIKYGYTNARIEADNNIIKLLIRRAFGFRKVENLIALIYLKCSNIEVPLPNRGDYPQMC